MRFRITRKAKTILMVKSSYSILTPKRKDVLVFKECLHATSRVDVITLQDVPCERVTSINGVHAATVCASHPQDVASVAFSYDGGAAAVDASRDVVDNHACESDVIARQVSAHLSTLRAFDASAKQIDAVPGTDERAGGSVVVTAGVG